MEAVAMFLIEGAMVVDEVDLGYRSRCMFLLERVSGRAIARLRLTNVLVELSSCGIE